MSILEIAIIAAVVFAITFLFAEWLANRGTPHSTDDPGDQADKQCADDGKCQE